MDYRPDVNEFSLWDTWMFPDPDGKRMHLYHLAYRVGPEGEKGVGHVISDDLVHWEELPFIQVRRPDDSYAVGLIGTGMVITAPSGEGFIMCYCAHVEGPIQKIAFMHSNDLVHWEKPWQEPLIEPKLPYYEVNPTGAASYPFAFRDAYIHRVGDHHEALIAAHAAYGPELMRACVARYRSDDPELHDWQPLPPLVGPGVAMLMEVPEHFEMDGKHYVIWNSHHGLGGPCNTPTRRKASGCFYAIADSYEGPYATPEEYLLIGAGGPSPRTIQSMVARTILWKGERLLYHQIAGPHPSYALPKRIVQQPDGTLKPGYWPGIEAIHREPLALPLDRVAVQGECIHVGDWEPIGACGLRGSIDGAATLGLVPMELEDVHLRCHVTLESGSRFGVCLRDPGQGTEVYGVALQGDVYYGEWQFGIPVHCWCSRIDPEDSIAEAPLLGRTYRIDMIVRDIYCEVYVDGIWKFTRCIPERARRGNVSFFVESGSARFERIQAWDLESMTHPCPEQNDG